MKACILFFGLIIMSIALVNPSLVIANEVVSREVITLQSRSGVTQKIILLKPSNPVASVVLLPGGVGKIVIGETNGKPTIKYKDNFLIRSMDNFAKNGFVVALVDAPSDQQSKGMYILWRIGDKHVIDINAVSSYLKKNNGLQVWLVGTSNGTFSTCNAAIHSGSSIDGIVLTSSITDLKPYKSKVKAYKTHPNGIINMDLAKITVPALIAFHVNDKCPGTPPANSEMLKAELTGSPRAQLIKFDGGLPPKSDKCKALSAHGFYGIEAEVVNSISEFIKSNL
jgi:hypothetical protein